MFRNTILAFICQLVVLIGLSPTSLGQGSGIVELNPIEDFPAGLTIGASAGYGGLHSGNLDSSGPDELFIPTKNGATYTYRVIDGVEATTQTPGTSVTWRHTIAAPAGAVGWGESLCILDDFDGDGYNEFAISSPGYISAGGIPGVVSIYDGNACVEVFQIQGSTFDGFSNFGKSIANGGDLDGDGFDDLIVGSPSSDRRLPSPIYPHGVVYIYSGATLRSSFTAAVSILSSAASRVLALPGATLPLHNKLRFGWLVAGGKDVTGDGVPDILVSGETYSSNELSVYLFSGTGSPTRLHEWTASNLTYSPSICNGTTIPCPTYPNADGKRFGYYSIGFTDNVDVYIPPVFPYKPYPGLNYPDIYIGDPGSLGTDLGGVFIVSSTSKDVIDYKVSVGGSKFGAGVAAVGDVDSDNYGDFVATSPSYKIGTNFIGEADLVLSHPNPAMSVVELSHFGTHVLPSTFKAVIQPKVVPFTSPTGAGYAFFEQGNAGYSGDTRIRIFSN